MGHIGVAYTEGFKGVVPQKTGHDCPSALTLLVMVGDT